jgi:cytochrome b
MNMRSEIRVWDPLIRVFHWTLVAAFSAAYLTEGEWLQVHTIAGYIVFGLLLLRILWGLIGTRHARFSDFIYRPMRVLEYLRDTIMLRAKRYLGHNPAGGAMVLLLIVSLLITTLTGMVVYGVEEQLGPLAAYVGGVGKFGGEVFEEVHEYFAHLSVILVLIHVIGVLVESLLHGENLIRSMLTGRKPAKID